MLGRADSSGASSSDRRHSGLRVMNHEPAETPAVQKSMETRHWSGAPQRYSTFPPSSILVQRRCISSGLTTSLAAARNQR